MRLSLTNEVATCGNVTPNFHCSHSDAGKKRRFDKKMEKKDMGGNRTKKYKAGRVLLFAEGVCYVNKKE